MLRVQLPITPDANLYTLQSPPMKTMMFDSVKVHSIHIPMYHKS